MSQKLCNMEHCIQETARDTSILMTFNVRLLLLGN